MIETSILYEWNLHPERYADVDPSEKIVVANQGGTSSGKTYTIQQVLCTHAIQNKDWIITIVGQDIPNLKRGAIRDMKRILSRNKLFSSQVVSYNGTDKVYTFKSGSIIEFTSYGDEQDAKNGKREVLFVNEANGVSKAIFDQLNMRTTYRTYLDYNPTAEFWFHDEVLGVVDNVAFFISNFQHNPFLHDNIKKEILQLKDIDEQLWRVYGLGQTGKIQGLVFNSKFIDYWPKKLKHLGYGLDFGYSNDPTVLVEAGLFNGKVHTRQIIYQKGLSNRDIHDLMKSEGVDRTKQIFADAADPKSIAELRRYGWNIKAAAKGKDSIMFSINLLKQYAPICISSASTEFVKEAKSYKWSEDKKTGKINNKPIDAFNHAWDALRYWAIMKINRQTGGILATN